MPRFPVHASALCWLLGVMSSQNAGAADAGADSKRVVAELSCPPAVAPGRVLCQLAIRARAPRLVWADALITRAPEFAKPLRARVGFSQNTRQDERTVVLPIALVAVASGSGELQVTARAVICPADPALACAPLSQTVRAPVTVTAREAS